LISSFGQITDDMAYFIEDNERIHLLHIGTEGQMSASGTIEIFDDDVKERLGTEKMELTAKSSVGCSEGWVVVGFEQNVVIKYPI
jgi:hypothetical protein